MGAVESLVGLTGAVAVAWGATGRVDHSWSVVLLIIGIVLIAIAVAFVTGKLWNCERNHARFESSYKACAKNLIGAATAATIATNEAAQSEAKLTATAPQSSLPPPPPPTTGGFSASRFGQPTNFRRLPFYVPVGQQ